MKAWDTTSPMEPLTYNMAGEGVAFSPDSKIMVTGQGLWLEAGKKARTVSLDGKGLLYFASDGKTLAVVRLPLFRLSLRINFFDAATMKLRQSISADPSSLPYALAFTPDWKLLAAVKMHLGVTLWEVDSGRLLATLPSQSGCVAISPDGKTLATAEKNGAIALWDLSQPQAPAQEVLHPPGAQPENEPHVTSVAFSPDGKTLAVASGQPYAGATPGEVTLWNLESRTVRATLRGHTGPVSAVAFSPDGRTLATGSYDRTVQLWDAATAEYLVTLKGHTAPVTAVVFRPDGKVLAAVGRDLSLRLWSAEMESDTR